MSFPIDILDFKDYISKENFTLEVYNSKKFYNTLVGFSLLATMEDYVSEIDRQKCFTIHNKMQWMEFLQLYYYRFNANRNILKNILKDGTISEWDIDFISNTIPFTIDALESIFRDNKKEPIFFANVIFAGRFYNSLHYYFKSIESFCQQHLDLTEKLFDNHHNLAIIEDERNWIDSVYDDLMKLRDAGGNIQIPEETHEKLTTMWYRTLEFFFDELIPEFIPKSA